MLKRHFQTTILKDQKKKMSKTQKKHSNPKYEEFEYSSHYSKKTKTMIENKEIETIEKFLKSNNAAKIINYDEQY